MEMMMVVQMGVIGRSRVGTRSYSKRRLMELIPDGLRDDVP